MDDKTVKKLRERHVEHISILGQMEDLHARAETQLMARPDSVFTRVLNSYCRWALRMCQWGEERAREKARKTY